MKTNWFEEGRKQFVLSKVHPEARPINYPTRDSHSAEQEADYIRGFNMQKNAWDHGERFAGMEAYAAELDEQRKTKGSEDDGRDIAVGVPAEKTESA